MTVIEIVKHRLLQADKCSHGTEETIEGKNRNINQISFKKLVMCSTICRCPNVGQMQLLMAVFHHVQAS